LRSRACGRAHAGTRAPAWDGPSGCARDQVCESERGALVRASAGEKTCQYDCEFASASVMVWLRAHACAGGQARACTGDCEEACDCAQARAGLCRCACKCAMRACVRAQCCVYACPCACHLTRACYPMCVCRCVGSGACSACGAAPACPGRLLSWKKRRKWGSGETMLGNSPYCCRHSRKRWGSSPAPDKRRCVTARATAMTSSTLMQCRPLLMVLVPVLVLARACALELVCVLVRALAPVSWRVRARVRVSVQCVLVCARSAACTLAPVRVT
jgi:hypothetical protein